MEKKEILLHLPQQYADKLLVMDSVDSTNSYLKRTADHQAEGTVVLARTQTGGRGRRGHTFVSQTGGIYLSVLLKPRCCNIATLTARTAVAVCDAIQSVCRVRPRIKWVNDLILNDKKLGGILVESVSVMGKIDHIIIGIGLNINTDFLNLSIDNIAISLKKYTGTIINTNQLAAALILRLADMENSDFCDSRRVWEQYKKDCLTLGQRIEFQQNGKAYRGTAVGLEEDYTLLVHTDNGELFRLNSGEISILPAKEEI